METNFNMEEWNAMSPTEQANELSLCVFKLGFSETITEDEQTILAVSIHKRTLNEYRKKAEDLVKAQATEKRLATRAANEMKVSTKVVNETMNRASGAVNKTTKKTPRKSTKYSGK